MTKLIPLWLVSLPTLVWADNSTQLDSSLAFNPKISLILDGNVYHDNKEAGNLLLAQMAGISHSAALPTSTTEEGLQNGFNLGESELVMSATVDPYFDGKLTLTVGSQGDTALEESWLQTRLLPAGLKVKFGKFLSGIGYQNSQHKHVWDFADQNLAYQGILGSESLKDTGIQATWLAPTAVYLLLGAEALQGNDQEHFGTLINLDDARSLLTATNPLPKHRNGPRLYTSFAKIAPDLGDVQTLQLGLSYARAQQYQQVIDADGSAQSGDEYALDGQQQLYGMDAVYKWDSAGEYGAGDVKITSEYLYLKKNMTVTAADSSSALVVGNKVTGKQAGYYLQTSYGIAPRWQLAARYDVNGNLNDLNENGHTVSLKQSQRQSLALSFYPSEFSRLRLQLGQGAIYDESGTKNSLKQVFLQYTLSLGPHGAHAF